MVDSYVACFMAGFGNGGWLGGYIALVCAGCRAALRVISIIFD